MNIISGQLRAALALTLISWSSAAFAICSGAASPDSLKAFIADPAAWLNSNGSAADVGSRARANAAAAVNSKDPGFGKALNAVLGKASGDQGTAIGKALGGLSGSCHDTADPDDVADKKYIAENILPNIAANSSANVAFGDASGPQTASTGGAGGGTGGGAGGGAGGVGGSTTTAATGGTGGSNAGAVTDTSDSTQTPAPSPSSIGASAAAAGTTTTNQTITTTQTISSTSIP